MVGSALAGKKVVVTGASGGLGTSVVSVLLERGASVVAVSRNLKGLEPLGDPDRGSLLELRVADVGTAQGAAKAVAGDTDALVHVAGAWAGGHPLADAPDDELDKMLEANLRSTWFAARAALRVMRASGRGGRIVLVASTGGLGAAPGSATYGATKAAVVSLVHSLAAEGKSFGVAVNAVAPGTIATAANRSAMPGADTSSWVTPDEVARTIAFLASDGSSGVSGAIVPVSRA